MVCRVNALYKDLKKEGIIFSFSGPISQSIVEGIGETIREKMAMEYARPAIVHRVFSVFVEQMQNILNYSDEVTVGSGERDKELKAGILILGQKEQQFYICCGNYINMKRAHQLLKDLAGIQSMSKEELKQLYKAQRQADPPDNSKGSGLGLIEIARRVSQPIEFDIESLNDHQAFFSIKAVI